MRRALHIIDENTRGDMLDHLSLLVREGETITSVGPPPQHERLPGGIQPVHAPLNSAGLCGWRMRDLANDVDLVHAWSARGAGAAVGVRYSRGAKVLRSLPHVPANRELRSLLKSMHKRNVHVTVPTAASRDALIRAGAPEDTVHLLPPPTEQIDHVRARRSRTRKELNLDDSEVLLIAPSEMTRQGGHKYAAWAHAILREVVPHVRLLFPGGGPGEQHVRFFAGTTGHDAEIFFTEDRLSPADGLAGADIALFFCERDRGVAALGAAMAGGLPIAASNTPDIAECAPHEQCALLVPPRDPRSQSAAVLRLVEDPILRKKLGQSAKRRAAKHFSQEGSRRRLDEIYEMVASTAPA